MLHFRALALLLAGLVLPGASSANPDQPAAAKITIGGTGGALGTMQLLAKAFKKTQPHVTVVIVPSLGSTGGIQALLGGAIDLALISRPLKSTEGNQGAIGIEYARTPFVFATGAQTKVSAITTPELVSIFAGERTTWPDGRPLRLILRPENDSHTDIVKSMSPAMSQAVKTAHTRVGMNVATTDQAAADRLETIPGALGTTTLAQIISEQRAIQALALDGVTPSLKNLAEGKYPYYKTFIIVHTPKTTALALQFVAFVRSATGQQILETNGHSVTPAK